MADAASGSTLGVRGIAENSPDGTGVQGRGGSVGVHGKALGSSGTGVLGEAAAISGSTVGVFGRASSPDGIGVSGEGAVGVRGRAGGAGTTAGLFEGNGGTILRGQLLGSDVFVVGPTGDVDISGFLTLSGGATIGGGVFISGDLAVAGNLSKGGGSFKIDHPLDPQNKYLYHSFVESPDMKNVYDGVVVLDAQGEAVVDLPEWFETLNSDFRYQLTALGAPMPGLYIAEEVQDSRFKIAGGKPAGKVSWQVTGIRQDPYARLHRIKVEEEKPESLRGYYLYPDLYGQPPEKGIGRLWERQKPEAASTTTVPKLRTATSQ